MFSVAVTSSPFIRAHSVPSMVHPMNSLSASSGSSAVICEGYPSFTVMVCCEPSLSKVTVTSALSLRTGVSTVSPVTVTVSPSCRTSAPSPALHPSNICVGVSSLGTIGFTVAFCPYANDSDSPR